MRLESPTNPFFKTANAETALPETYAGGFPYAGMLDLGPGLMTRPSIHATIDADVVVGNKPIYVAIIAQACSYQLLVGFRFVGHDAAPIWRASSHCLM
jgi:hypothetical protein